MNATATTERNDPAAHRAPETPAWPRERMEQCLESISKLRAQ